jgi:predicted ATPase/DNA-binding SARP family transcriptional activator
MHVDITLLGGFSVVVDGRPIDAAAWTRRDATALVKVLALRPGRRLPRERLVDLLWPDLLLDRAAPRLHKAAHRARTSLGTGRGVVLVDGVVSLLPDAEVTVDVERFERVVAAGSADDAIALYAGDLLPDDLYETWSHADRERLRAVHLDLLRGAGRWEDVLASEPLDEEAHIGVLRSHVEAGRRGHALRHLDQVEQLWREVGAMPGEALGAVRAEIEAMPAAEGSRHALPRGWARLPRPSTRTVGRDTDVAAVLDLLARGRLVTLLGVGGVGKTRLAAEVAHRVVQETAQRSCYVDLTKVSEPGQVAGLVVRELGIRAGDDQDAVQVLAEALHRQSLLLVLDNFEHVVAAADVVAGVLERSAGVRVLVTSRARLRLGGEQVHEVRPLAVTAAAGADHADAVALFDQVARAVDPDFDLAQHLEAVGAICASVDGLPLAIEIAGGHLRTLSAPLLRERLADRLASGVVAARDLPDRHQTIPSTIDWSLQLLGDRERRLFARLSVFRGPVPLDAVEAVWPESDAVDPLSVLVDHSLVRRSAGATGEPAFGMLSLVREHAATLLPEERAAAEAARATYVADHLDDLYERRWTDAADRWLDDITGLLQEVRAARAWAVGRGDVALAARIAAALGAYWFLEGHQVEGQRWTQEALAEAAILDPAVVARLHLASGFLAFPHSQWRAREHWELAVAMFRALAEPRLLAYALAVTSVTYVGAADRYAHAIRVNDEALRLAREAASPSLVAQVLNIRGEITRVAGHDDLARAAYEEGLAISTDLDDEMYVSVFLANLSYLADHRGDYAEARRLTHAALRMCRTLGRRLMAAWTVSQLAGPEHGLGHSELGAVLVGAADEALRVLGARRHPGDVPEHERVVTGIRTALGEDRFDELRADGARMSLDEVLDLVLGGPASGAEGPLRTGTSRA